MSSDTKSTLWYRDKQVEDCSREELIAAIYLLHEDLESERRWLRVDEQMRRDFDTARAAIGTVQSVYLERDQKYEVRGFSK